MKKNITIEDFENYKIDSVHAGNYCEFEGENCILKEGKASEPGNVRLLRIYNDTEETTDTLKVCSQCESLISNKLEKKHS